jgi:hypothetical protein
MANNKIHTRDNLAKRKTVDDNTCLFCGEAESVQHIFFDCCVAKCMWEAISELTGLSLGVDFESIAKLWLSDKRYKCANIITTAALWSLWKTRNNICFQGVCWQGMSKVLGQCARLLKNWKVLPKQEDWKKIEHFAEELKLTSASPSRVTSFPVQPDPESSMAESRESDESYNK